MEKKRYRLELVWIVAFLLILIASIIAPPLPGTPKTVTGFVFYDENEEEGVPNGTIVWINDTNGDPDILVITYVDSVSGLEGAYSADIPGANATDEVIVTSFNATAYGRSYSNLTATTTYVNVTLNLTRPSETDLNITNPSNHTFYNVSESFYLNFSLAVIGGTDGIGCNVRISFTNDSIMNISSEESIEKSLGNINLQNSIESAWNISVNDVGTVNITVDSWCSSDGENFENHTWDMVFNLTSEDHIPPRVRLDEPLNGTLFNSTTILFKFTSIDETSIDNCTLILDHFENETNFTVVSDEQAVLNVPNIGDGWHNWTVNCVDLYNNIGQNGSLLYFFVDSVLPNVSLVGPLNGSEGNNLPVIFNWTAEDNFDEFLLCNLTISNNLVGINILSQSGVITEKEIDSLSDGIHDWNVTCVDDALNVNTSMTWYYSLSIPMEIMLVYPEENNISNTENISFIYNVTDNDDILECSVLINDVLNESNSTPILPGEYNEILVENLPEGYHNWALTCKNDLGVWYNSSEIRNFIVDLYSPTIDLSLPENGSEVNITAVNFSWIASDTLDDTLVCNLSVDEEVLSIGIDSPNGTLVSNVSYLSVGEHNWSITCIDNATNINTSEVRFFNITLPDLSIVSEDIIFNDSSPPENTTIEVNATIRNLGDADVLNTTVRFYSGDPNNGGTQINGDFYIPLNAGESRTLTVNYTPSVGLNEIFVLVDPPVETNGTIEELDGENNNASNSFTVSSWHLVYGFLTDGRLDLNDSDNESVYIWDVSDTSETNIFVADSDSIIDFSSLKAIGKNTLGGDSVNDFEEIDILLNMSGLSDSITNLYTSDGVTPINTTEYYIFNKNISGIPITNSTNNTNFYTGILWDSSDDASADNEFNITDAEDLVFMTQVNIGAQGAYGNYDYEIRIPAYLREYKDGGTTVSFYVELK